MNGNVEHREWVFGMPLPDCLVGSIKDHSWANLAHSPMIETVFGQAPLRAVFHSIPVMVGMTKWWREELDDELLRCYFGKPDERADPGYISRMKTVIIGNLGPDLPFALDYRESPVDPDVVFLGEVGSWRMIAGSVHDLMCALDPQRLQS